MTLIELKQAILEYIRDLYKVEYVGGLKVESLNNDEFKVDDSNEEAVGYRVSFNLDKSENPLVIMADLPAEEFLPFIKEELRKRKLHKAEHYYCTKLPPITQNCCNERKRTY